MTLPTAWLSAGTLRLLALSLLHFLWQGAALAALAYVVMALCRSAAVRYATGVATLALMLGAPVATFLVFRSPEQAVSPTVTASAGVAAEAAPALPILSSVKNPTSRHESAPTYFLWLVEFWFAGVVLLSLRSAGGILLVEWLRLRETLPVTEEVMEICRSLQERMGLTRAVRYCESLHLDTPAVAGWMRPVVLLPVSALTGLSAAQLEAVIAHELAHIQRYDTFVNLFQVGVETLLFYHPAVWWLGKRIRRERENCCDDAAVALCGSPVTYAHALTRLAESKQAPQLAMAANRSPLVERIARLLGANRTAESFRGAHLSAGVLCLSAALLAGSALLGSVHYAQAQSPAPAAAVTADVAVAEEEEPSPGYRGHVPEVPRIKPSAKASVASPSSAPAPAPAVGAHPAPVALAFPRPAATMARSFSWSFVWRASPSYSVSSPAVASFSQDKPAGAPQSVSDSPKQSYIDSINAAGLTNLTADEIINLKIQGITADYIKSVRDMNIKVDVDTLVGMKVQGVTAEYIKEMRSSTGQSLDADELIGLKVQGVTPEYVQQMHGLGLKTDADDVIGMKVQGVTPEYIKEMHNLGVKIDADDIIGMKVQGVTPEYVKEMRGLGLKVDTADDLIGLKVQGVSPDYVKGFHDLGFHPSADELIGMKVQGVTPAYLKELQAAGFKVDVDEAIAAKVQGITPEFIAKVKSHGFKDLTMDKLIALKETGVLDAEK
jgi:beta-lactamase regulating signal transducer with metallopeptidase domain